MIAKAPLRCGITGEVLQGLTLQLMAESKIPMLKYQSLHGPLYNAGLQGKLDKEEGGVCPSKSLIGLQETGWLRKWHD